MYVSGEELRALSNIMMEGWDLEREDRPENEDPILLIAKGSWGGNTRIYVIKTNEDGELEGVIRMGQYGYGHPKARQQNPGEWQVINAETGEPNSDGVLFLSRDAAFEAAKSYAC